MCSLQLFLRKSYIIELILILYFRILEGIFDGDNVKGCYRPCDYMDISFGYPSIYDIQNNSSLTLYFKKSIPIRESHIAYPKSSLFAEIGGYMGLLLGFSFLDFAKVVQCIFKRFRMLGNPVRVDNHLKKDDMEES